MPYDRTQPPELFAGELSAADIAGEAPGARAARYSIAANRCPKCQGVGFYAGPVALQINVTLLCCNADCRAAYVVCTINGALLFVDETSNGFPEWYECKPIELNRPDSCDVVPLAFESESRSERKATRWIVPIAGLRWCFAAVRGIATFRK
jgi:hypothetical protein